MAGSSPAEKELGSKGSDQVVLQEGAMAKGVGAGPRCIVREGFPVSHSDLVSPAGGSQNRSTEAAPWSWEPKTLHPITSSSCGQDCKRPGGCEEEKVTKAAGPLRGA